MGIIARFAASMAGERRMKKSLIALALVAGCGASGSRGGGNATGTAETGGDGLTGFYESGPASRPNQLCMIEKGGKATFGIVLWGANLRSCSGAGSAARLGDRLVLTMAGDSPCTIEASLTAGVVTLPDVIPSGCAYYCGDGATFSRAGLIQRGGTVADAMKAKDLAGEPLCS
jgi:hypothetical protein